MHRLQSTQSPWPSPAVARLVLAARLAAPLLVGDDHALLVEHGGLEARPRAHIGADLLARPAGQQVGRGRQQADAEIDFQRGLAAEDPDQRAGGVDVVEDPGSAGGGGDGEPGRVLGGLAQGLARRHRRAIEPHALVAVALDQALDQHEQVGPDGLRTGVAAPDPAEQRRGEEQAEGGEDQEAGDEVDFLRPDDDVEEPAAPPVEVDQDRLVGRAGAAVPAQPRHEIVDAEQQDERQPLDPPPGAGDGARIDLDAGGVERQPSLVRPQRDRVVVGEPDIHRHSRGAPSARRPGSGRRWPAS